MQEHSHLRLSRWCKYFINGEVLALFHSLSLGVFYLPKDVGIQVLSFAKDGLRDEEWRRNLGEEIVNLLISERMLVNVHEDDMAYLVELRNRLVQEIHLELMYLLLTDACNLRCRYCFEDSPNSPFLNPSLMDLRTVNQAIEYFARLTERYGRRDSKKVIHLYGGEPLLNKQAVTASVLKVDQMKRAGLLPKACEVVLVTNGTLFDSKLAKLFAKYGVTVGFSLDGPARFNNIYRLAKRNSTDVFAKVMSAYRLARDSGVSVGLSVTITPEIAQNFDEVLDFFIKDLGIQDGLSFNILHYNPAVPVDHSYFELAAQCLIRAFEIFRKLGIYEERMVRKVTAFVEREPMHGDCGAVGNQIVVAPDGRIGVCQDFVKPRTYFGGNVFDKHYDPVKGGLFNGWSDRSPLFMEQCFDCEALGICGGGCPASAELKTGSRWNIDERICPHSKLTLQWLIWDTYSHTVDKS